MQEKMVGRAAANKKPETKLARNLRITFGLLATAGFLFLFIKIAMTRFG